MPPNTSSEKCSVIVTIYKYFEVESEEKYQSVAGKNIVKSQKYAASACILMLIDYILVYYTVGSITFFVCLFVLWLNVPVNNFSVMSGRSHHFLGN